MNSIKKDIRALSKEELRAFFATQGDQAFRGTQVYEWLWQKGAHHFEDMTNLSKDTRQMLDKNFSINHIEVDSMQRSLDGTIKKRHSTSRWNDCRIGTDSHRQTFYRLCIFSSWL